MKTIALLLYNLLFPVALLIMLPGQWLKMRRRGGYGVRWGERFGRFEKNLVTGWREMRPWWIHAVSVGEVLIALRLIESMRQTGGWSGPVVLSLGTSTGRQLAESRCDENTVVVWMPLDVLGVMSRAVRRMNPERIILVEAEFWPNMLRAAERLGIPVQTVNARLSVRSEKRFLRFSCFLKPFFELLDHVCVQVDDDVSRFVRLGVPEGRITVAGSIKFDNEARGDLVPGLDSVKTAIDQHPALRGKRLILAASTHPGEEEMIAEAWAVLRQEHSDLGFVAVPRHFERTAEAAKDLVHLGLHPDWRSRSGKKSGDCLLVDVTGELQAWCEVATVVVVGKSFPPHTGGQNPAESVRAGKPTVVGPRMDNFKVLMESLEEGEGIRRVGGGDELLPALANLLEDAEGARAMAERGRAVLTAHDGATRRTLEALLQSKLP